MPNYLTRKFGGTLFLRFRILLYNGTCQNTKLELGGALLNNLRKIDEAHILIWHLY